MQQEPAVGERRQFGEAIGEWDGRAWIEVTEAPSQPTPEKAKGGSLWSKLADAASMAIPPLGLARNPDSAIGAVKGLGQTASNLGLAVHAVPGVTSAIDYLYRQRGLSENAFNEADRMLTPTNAAQAAGKTAEQIGEFLVPVGLGAKAASLAPKGAGLLAKGSRFLARSAGEAAEMGARSAIQTQGNPEDVKRGAALGAAGPVVSGALKTAGNVAFKNLPERLYGQVFKTAEDDLRAAYQSMARGGAPNPTMAREAMARGVWGTSRDMAVSSLKTLDKLESELQTVVTGKNIKLPQKQDYVALLGSLADEFGGVFSSMGKHAADLRQRIVSGIRGPYVSASDALELKRLLDSARNTSAFRLSAKLSPKQEEYKTAADLVRKTIHDTIKPASTLLNEERIYINAVDSIVKDAAQRNNRRLLGLTDYILGGGGMAAGVGVSGVGAAAMVRGFQNPLTLTGLGQGLHQAGQVVPSAETATRGAIGAGSVLPRKD